MWELQKQEVVETAQQICQKGLVAGTSGNVSLRFRDLDGKDVVAITPSGLRYDIMRPDDIVIVDLQGHRVEGDLAPSIETMLHIEIYRARKKVNAVIHAHPVYSSVIAVAGLEIPAILDDQVTQIGGELKVAEYALSGSPELVRNVIAALEFRNAALLANHGAIALGRNLWEAFTVCQLVEKTAKVYLLALGLGKVNQLPVDACELERAFYNALHGEG